MIHLFYLFKEKLKRNAREKTYEYISQHEIKLDLIYVSFVELHEKM